MTSTKKAPGGSLFAKRIKRRFQSYRQLFYSIAITFLAIDLLMIFNFLMDFAKASAGMDASFKWVCLLVMISALYGIATRIDYFASFIDRLEQEYLQLADLQNGYMRNAEIVESRDNLQGSYHNKIYRSVVRDIDHVINK